MLAISTPFIIKMRETCISGAGKCYNYRICCGNWRDPLRRNISWQVVRLVEILSDFFYCKAFAMLRAALRDAPRDPAALQCVVGSGGVDDGQIS